MNKNVFSSLGDDINIACLNICGTHDSATAYVSMENAARCQSLTIKEQLDMGVRLLDIRLCRKRGEFYLIHSLADCYTDENKKERLVFGRVLEEVFAFLENNPRETVILSIKQDRGIMSKSFFPELYDKYIKGNENKWYLKNRMPALKQVRGKAVLMRRCKLRAAFVKENECGLDFSEWKDQGKKRLTAEELFMNESTVALIQDRYCLDKKEKWHNCAKKYLDTVSVSQSSPAVHFLSTSVRTDGSLVATAEYINGEFMKYPLDNIKGWILCDFLPGDLADKINMSNFKI